MALLSRPSLNILGSKTAVPISYPASALVQVAMNPADFFGVEPVTSNLSVVPAVAELTANPTDYRGPGRVRHAGRLPLMDFSSTFMGHQFRVNGNVATFELTVANFNELHQFIADIDSLVPALFSVVVNAPVEINDIRGRVHESSFVVVSNLAVSNSVEAVDLNSRLKQQFDKFDFSGHPIPPYLRAAARYIQQGTDLRHMVFT